MTGERYDLGRFYRPAYVQPHHVLRLDLVERSNGRHGLATPRSSEQYRGRRETVALAPRPGGAAHVW
jgi:hypothetical protein